MQKNLSSRLMCYLIRICIIPCAVPFGPDMKHCPKQCNGKKNLKKVTYGLHVESLSAGHVEDVQVVILQIQNLKKVHGRKCDHNLKYENE